MTAAGLALRHPHRADMGEMATRSIQTLIDRFKEICNELMCVRKKEDQYSLTFVVEVECVYGFCVW